MFQQFLYFDNILLTHPCETLSCFDISHGLVPFSDNSTIILRTSSGNGLPFTNVPPSWLMPLSKL